MGRPPKDINKSPFPEIWGKIKNYHEANYQIRLRPAANLVGFSLFPFGWSWNEFIAISDEDTEEYEREALILTHIGEALESSVSKAGNRARQRGKRFRAKRATEFLKRFISRQEIQHYLGRRRYSQNASDYDYDHISQKEIDAPLDKRDYDKILIEESLVGLHRYAISPIWVDALDLIKVLHSRLETRGREPKSDWGHIEIKLRKSIERDGMPELDKKLIKLVLENPLTLDEHEEPRQETLRQLIRTLRTEYERSK